MASTITREQLYHRYRIKQEEIQQQLQIDLDKIQNEILFQNELGKTKVMMAYPTNSNENGYIDVLIQKIYGVFIDSTVTVNINNEITIDWTLPFPSANK